MREIRTPKSLTDRYEAARFLEAIAYAIRNGNYDVQSVYESLEITSQSLNGFHINITGQIQHIISAEPSLIEKAERIFHQRHKVHGGWIRTLIEEAEYQVGEYFEYAETLVEDAYETYLTPELVYQVAYRLWEAEDVMNTEWVRELSSETIDAQLPREAFQE